jgi:hypothetical protein
MTSNNDLHEPRRETKHARDEGWKREADKIGRDLAAHLCDAWRGRWSRRSKSPKGRSDEGVQDRADAATRERESRHLAEAQVALKKAARHLPPDRAWAREKVDTVIAEIRRLQIQLAEAPADLEGGVR